jgi:hypothetical protein
MRALAVVAFTGVAMAHPMGNFSVNHYARLEPGSSGLTITYVLDLAELPTTELIQSWGVERDAPRSVLEAQASAQARQWAANLKVTENGKPILGIVQSTQLAMESGAANLPIYRISERIRFLAKGGRIEYEDGNYATRAGWREIVVRSGDGAELKSASNGPDERSKALTSYPKDQEKSPPQDAKAWLEWSHIARPSPPVTASSAPPAPMAVPTIPAKQAEAPPSQSPPPEPPAELNSGRATRAMGIVLGLIAVLFLARYATRSHHPGSRYPGPHYPVR